jgi:hypothetical protein
MERPKQAKWTRRESITACKGGEKEKFLTILVTEEDGG